ncbi:MAG: hypothetical protein V3V08_01015 [Nannocystaceae bacterium]
MRTAGRAFARGVTWLRRNAYLALSAACLLLLARVVDFAAPQHVRIDPDQAARVVGDAPWQGFSTASNNANAVQFRATLRRYADAAAPVSGPDARVDATAQILSQPVVTTIMGVEANIEQTVRLDGGDLELHLSLVVTPRADGPRYRGRRRMTVEREFVVERHRRGWLDSSVEKRIHLKLRGVLTVVEGRIQRTVFSVGEHLFALDVEIQRSRG